MLKAMVRRAGAAVAVTLSFAAAAAGADYVFANAAYLKATAKLVNEARAAAAPVLAGSPQAEKFFAACDALEAHVSDLQRRRLQKKITPDTVDDRRDRAFADALNAFKDGLNFVAQKANAPLESLVPSYAAWNRLEASVVREGLDKRLAAFQTRFGPDSEPINVVELLIGEAFLPGNEAGPSPWEPILRFTAAQLTTGEAALTSSVEAGANYYFLRGAPKALALLGVRNHVGLAGTLQYLDDPRVFRFRGRPSYGAVVHLDRKVVGAVWDTDEEKWRLTLGYSFQFVPFLF